MNGLVVWLRFFLTAAAAFGTTLFAPELAVDEYLTHMLLFAFLMQAEVWIARRNARYAAAILVGQTAYAAWIAWTFGGMSSFLFYSILISVFRLKLGWPMAAVQLAAMNVGLHRLPPEDIASGNAVWGLLAGLLYIMQRTSSRSEEIQSLYDLLRSKHYELQDARKRLMEHAKQVETLTAAEERNRISRDLHDEVGHRLIRLKMMMEAVVRIMPEPDGKAAQLVAQVRDQLAECMDILRSTVRKIKPVSGLTQQYSLTRLIEGFASGSGITVDYQITGMPYPLYPSEELILYRNAQEAITNAIRHGEATEVRIALNFEADGLTFHVSNNGRLPERGLGSKGLGLTGMEERVKLYGGELNVETEPVFRIVTRLPRRKAAMQ